MQTKRILLLALLALIAAPALRAQDKQPDNSALLHIQSKAPDFLLPTVDGEAKIALSDYAGRYLVIDFWASWCPDCRKANPRMVDLYERYANDDYRIDFLGVSFDTDREACLRAIEKDGLEWPQVSELKKWKETDIARQYGIRWIPTVYVIDNMGRVLFAGNDLDELEKLLHYIGGVGSGEAVGYTPTPMSTAIAEDSRKVPTHRLFEMKQRGEKIAMLTAYDYSMAQIIDRAGMDVILVGDSASNVMAGNITTLPITLDQMIYHGKSVVKAVRRALVVVDLPFGSYQGNSKEALASAIRVMKETHADCIKMEGGAEIRESIQRILCAGIPIMGHLGLTPQSINKFGTYTVRAREEEEAAKLIEDAHLLEEWGCFALVLEKIPAELATHVASQLRIPVIGIGAGGGVDGQVLVMHDMLGINQDFSPRFLRRYADLNTAMTNAVQAYINDIKTQDFPNESEQY